MKTAQPPATMSAAAASQPGDNFAVLAVPNETPNPRQHDSLRVFVMARLCRERACPVCEVRHIASSIAP
jgi:hypothetical protein